MERTFELAISREIEDLYCHIRDHDAGRCDCDSLLDETEALAFRLDQVRSEMKNTLLALRAKTPLAR